MEKGKKEQKKGSKVLIPAIVLIVLVLGGGVFWYRDYSKYISTDDAFIDANRVAVGSKILGRISFIGVEEGDTVKKGQLLAVIDSSELQANKNQAQASKEQAIAAVSQSEAKLESDKQNIKLQEINLQRAKDDFTRAKTQFEGGVLTQEQFDHIKKSYETAQANLDAANVQLSVTKTQIASSRASVQTIEAQIGVIRTQLGNTKLYAPFEGIVAKRWVLAGDIVQPGQSIVTITQDTAQWVIVYIEETKLSDIKVGQQTIFTIDAFSDLSFNGHVFTKGSNTASQFSLIPPNNAAGNFTKTTQRVPIKISIDSVTAKDGSHPKVDLVSGMSVVMKIIR